MSWLLISLSSGFLEACLLYFSKPLLRAISIPMVRGVFLHLNWCIFHLSYHFIHQKFHSLPFLFLVLFQTWSSYYSQPISLASASADLCIISSMFGTSIHCLIYCGTATYLLSSGKIMISLHLIYCASQIFMLISLLQITDPWCHRNVLEHLPLHWYEQCIPPCLPSDYSAFTLD